ncbi:MAG: polysaccharide deacetylase family protein [Proteobacteria bacterium]|nr:polysaccharide deacetylase family protein [Pseudomonadota bacterium]
MPAERRYGTDHPHYAWSPLPARERLRLPRGARVALCVLVSLEHLDWSPPAGSHQPPGLYHRPLPEYWAISIREYGHRVGVYRILDLLARYRIRPTIAMDALTAEHYPYLVRYCVDRGAEVIAHGVAVSRMITSRMGEEEERRAIETSIAAVTRATGTAPRGWFGPEYGESERTPRLLAEFGIDYCCDWVNDEQPYPMTTPTGALTALPIALELDDVFALRDRRFPVDGWARNIRQAFDRCYRDGAKTGRVMVLSLHPHLSGQPFRIGFLDEAIRHIMGRKAVWPASGSEIVDWYRKGGKA